MFSLQKRKSGINIIQISITTSLFNWKKKPILQHQYILNSRVFSEHVPSNHLAPPQKEKMILPVCHSKSNAINTNDVSEEEHQGYFQCPTGNQFTC